MTGDSSDERDEAFRLEKKKASLGKLIIRIIQAIAAMLAVTFAYLELQNAPIDRLTQAFDAHSLTKLGLFLFFTGWLYGAMHDTEIQEQVYKMDPGEGLIGWREVLAIILFLVFFVGLFLVHERLVLFQAVLTGFILANVYGWREILRRANAMILRSTEHFVRTKNNACLAKLAIVLDYMNGQWQRRRFKTLFALCLVQLAIAILVDRGMMQIWLGGLAFGGVPGEVLAAYLPGTLFIVYVLISETWMKVYRIKAFSDMRTIDYIGHYFVLGRRPRVPLPSTAVRGLFEAGPKLNDNYC